MVDDSALTKGPPNITYAHGIHVLEVASVAYTQLELGGPQRWALQTDIGFGNVRAADPREVEGLRAIAVGEEEYRDFPSQASEVFDREARKGNEELMVLR